MKRAWPALESTRACWSTRADTCGRANWMESCRALSATAFPIQLRIESDEREDASSVPSYPRAISDGRNSTHLFRPSGVDGESDTGRIDKFFPPLKEAY